MTRWYLVERSWYLVCTAGEYDGTIGVHTLDASGKPSTQLFIRLADDLLVLDWDDKRKVSNRRKKVIAEAGGKSFVLTTLQDAGAVVVYDITDPNPKYDSGLLLNLMITHLKRMAKV